MVAKRAEFVITNLGMWQSVPSMELIVTFLQFYLKLNNLFVW